MEGLLHAPTQWELLNGGGINDDVTFSIATSSSKHSIPYEIEQANRIMKNTRPHGYTPLVRKVLAIEDYCLKMNSAQYQGKKQNLNVSVIIATNGLGQSNLRPHQRV